ncbi:MAG: flagellin [Proteobacteria bacterium]|nr:flagellin [Pseudomonadota bacterium]MBU1709790.1 flagellin [Pseudomonadota bacterium]
MTMKINSNTSALFSFNRLQENYQAFTKSLERLSSGRRINQAADDSSGMSIANALESQKRGFGQAVRNATDAISIVQTADGALGEMSNILQEMRVKALQASSDSQSVDSRRALQAGINRSVSTLNDISRNTSYNGQILLSGQFTDKNFQVGATSGETISVSIGSVTPDQLGGGNLSELNVTTFEGAQDAITAIDEALSQLNSERSGLGSTQNQLRSSISNLSNSFVNAAAAESTIADVDFADESATFSNFRLLLKANIFALSQANKVKESSVMNLLQG